MTGILIFLAGLVVGVVYHAFLQPYVAQAWVWLRDRLGTRKDAE